MLRQKFNCSLNFPITFHLIIPWTFSSQIFRIRFKTRKTKKGKLWEMGKNTLHIKHFIQALTQNGGKYIFIIDFYVVFMLFFPVCAFSGIRNVKSITIEMFFLLSSCLISIFMFPFFGCICFDIQHFKKGYFLSLEWGGH